MPAGISFAEAFIKTSAEGAFKRQVKQLTNGVDVETFEALAGIDITFAQLVEKAGQTIPETKPNAWTNHLLSLSKERYLEMIGEVSPRHADVLRRNPNFADEIVNGLRRLVAPQ